MSEEPENSTAVVAVLSGLLAFIVILKTLLLAVLFQRREIRLFGNCFLYHMFSYALHVRCIRRRFCSYFIALLTIAYNIIQPFI